MKKGIYLSLACSLWINAAEVELETINVATKVDTEVVKDVSGEDIKSADLAEALFKQSPSVALSRRSGIANDIVVRGQRKDNINVTVDGTKVYGACPNRMDPPVSHILTNNVDYIEINEGPFNVEDFGVLSADVKIHTVKPSDEFEGEVNLGLGSWGYKKGSFSLSGGITDNVRVLLSGSTETGEQYEDGDGNDFVGQIQREIDAENVPPMVQYQPVYRDMDAYSKKTLMAKLFWDITDNQELRLSYTANRSDDVLYPSSKMDALYDDSDIYNIEYIAKDLGAYSKELNIQVYQSEVEHPMSNMYRISSLDGDMTAPGLQPNVVTHALTTKMQGAKLSNSFDMDNHTITAGLDYSKRNWDGRFYKNGNAGMKSINDVDTENYALFLKDKIKMDKFVLDLGMRYDDTKITSQHPSAALQPDNDYNELNGYILGTYNKDENTKYYAGFGKSSRVPDARELYLMMMGTYVGTPDLENTVNYEFDIGAEKKYENATIKAKAFYSMLNDFIAYNADSTSNNLENVDATIWGVELSGTYIATDSVYFDYGMSYQRGKKKDPLGNPIDGYQTDKDMPEIPPFKFNGAVNYDYDESLALRAEVIASDEWTDFDADNGEQELDAYAVLNLKGTKKFGKNFELTVGVDNLFDTTYAVTNTYKDITLLPTTSVDTNIMLLNEPGRYFYTNIKYKF